uniref:NB-ARC domain-containing protein n=1 Tax=Arundo donax TaxID=35708 RepID=A0A0A9CPM8_ARUDO
MQVIYESRTKSALDRAKHIISRKAPKLKKVLNKLEKLVEEGSRFSALLASTTSSGSNVNDTSNPANNVTKIVTTSSGPTQIIFGRDKERDEIIRLLHGTSSNFDPSSSNSNCYSMIAIYGIAGSGKTTLAQHVYAYEKMGNYFDLFMWIHVSQSFSVGKVFQEMLEAASGEPSHEFCNLNTLQEKLEGKLKCKRYFLVLDDIWAGKDVGVHEYKLNQLLSPLESGKKGSMVLVTTQFKDAAKSLGAHGPMRIPDLNETDLFDLFMHFALDGANLDAQELETFQMIGKQIVKKLKGHI